MKRWFGSLGLILAIMLCIPLTPVSASVSHPSGFDAGKPISGLPSYLASQSHSFSNLLPAGTDIPNTTLNAGAITAAGKGLQNLEVNGVRHTYISDFDGDGKSDVAVFRPSTSIWYLNQSSEGIVSKQWGDPTDIPVPGDYDGDGKTDVAVFRPSTKMWYLNQSSEGIVSKQWGDPTDIPVPGDYDGDGKTDVAVFRPSTKMWYLNQSSEGIVSKQWGDPTDIPVPGDYDGDGKTDVAVFRPSTNMWYLNQSSEGIVSKQWGDPTDIPVPGDYDGDGKTDVAVFRPSTSIWYLNQSSGGIVWQQWGMLGDIPLPGTMIPPQQYLLVANVSGNGMVTKSPDQASYNSGTLVQLTAIPDPGWSFDGWTGDLNGMTNPANITMNANKAVSATFTQTSLPAARIVFTFDDGWFDTHTYALPIMQAAGFKGTTYVMRDAVNEHWPNMMDASQLDDLYDAGWDISNHTTNHDDNGAATDPDALEDLETEYRENQEWIIANGWTRGAYHACYPSGAFSDELITILQGMGVLTGRSIIDGIQAIPVTDFFRIPVQYVETEHGMVAEVKASIDSAIASGGTVVLMIHRVMPTDGNLVTTRADLQSIVNYVLSKSNNIAVMTMSEWYNYAIEYQSLTAGQYQVPPATAMFEPGFVQIEAELLADAKARAK
jgi:peptidoglycan/xylan/chitin deacetylase (PgdA/CDA1 family)